MRPDRIVERALLRTMRDSPCIACRKEAPSDPCHIKSRGAGGKNVWTNLLPMCRECHSLQHSKGLVYMWDKFARLKAALLERGWFILDIGQRRQLKRYGS